MTALFLIVTAALLGSMLFFPVVVAPMVFRTLPAEQAGGFLRAMFPRYYAWGTALSGVALVVAIQLAFLPFLLLSLVVIGFVFSLGVLVPGINAARDEMTSGGGEPAARRFRRLHGLSVVVNLVQIALLVALLARYTLFA